MVCLPRSEQWEPAEAVFGGPDGTDVIARVLAGMDGAGVTAPVIGLEIGQGQGERVAAMLRAVGWSETEVRA